MFGYNHSRFLKGAIDKFFKHSSIIQNRILIPFSTQSQKYHSKKFKIIEDPKQANKLIFDESGRCRIFEHKNGESEMKWIMRVGTFFTVLNSFLMGAEIAFPIFGAWNMVSFSVCSGLGFLFLATFQILAKRTIYQIYLHNNLENIDCVFFNPFWKPKTITFHITEFQDLIPSYFGYIKVDLTSIGKTWIKVSKNEFRNVKDYEETLDCILLGKPITNLKINNKAKSI